jgi:predicted Fe-S protein YdhL (DUF1289 family)
VISKCCSCEGLSQLCLIVFLFISGFNISIAYSIHLPSACSHQFFFWSKENLESSDIMNAFLFGILCMHLLLFVHAFVCVCVHLCSFPYFASLTSDTGCMRVVKENLNWGTKSELKAKVLRGIKEIGSVLYWMGLLDIVLVSILVSSFHDISLRTCLDVLMHALNCSFVSGRFIFLQVCYSIP